MLTNLLPFRYVIGLPRSEEEGWLAQGHLLSWFISSTMDAGRKSRSESVLRRQR